jgi:hypothetical protein
MLAAVQFHTFSIPACCLQTQRLKYTDRIILVFIFGKIDTLPYADTDRDSAVGIAARYGLDGAGIESL